MNAQEIFDTVARHLAAQGHRSIATMPDGKIGCAYRAGSNKCAFGVFIPDDRYDPRMESRRAGVLIGIGVTEHKANVNQTATILVEPLSAYPDFSWMAEYQGLFNDLQKAHDRDSADADADAQKYNGDEPLWSPSMETRLRFLANRHALDPAILDTLSFPENWV